MGRDVSFAMSSLFFESYHTSPYLGKKQSKLLTPGVWVASPPRPGLPDTWLGITVQTGNSSLALSGHEPPYASFPTACKAFAWPGGPSARKAAQRVGGGPGTAWVASPWQRSPQPLLAETRASVAMETGRATGTSA